MTIEKITKLEHVHLAFRGDMDGGYKGGHVQYFTVIKEDGVEISRQQGRATTISEAAAAGFTMPDVAAAINLGLIVANEAQAAQLATLSLEKADADQAKTVAESARDAALAQVQELQAQLDAYVSPVAVNGVPEWVYKSQAYKALTVTDNMDKLTAALATAATQSMAGKLAKIDFETSAKFYRNHPTVAMFVATGLFTDAQVDDLFKLAATFAV